MKDYHMNLNIFGHDMQDISLGVALGSATQISMFVVRTKNSQQDLHNLLFFLVLNFENSKFCMRISGSNVCDCCLDNGY